jgi:indole-3-acetate monooxygenase
MTHPAGQAEPTDSQILRDVIALRAVIQAASDELEQERRLPKPIADALKKAGVFGMAMPGTWGGPELDPATQFRVVEALAMADGSVGWCAMSNSDGACRCR